MAEDNPKHHLSHHHHMRVQWEEFFLSDNKVPVEEATLVEKSSIVGRVGLMLLSCGTGAWRVRESMDAVAKALDLTCTADIGLLSLVYTCFDVNNQSYTQFLGLSSSGVNMTKLYEVERFVRQFTALDNNWTIGQVHRRLSEIQHQKTRYSLTVSSFASAFASAGFIYLLGGGIPEIICSFIGAGLGNLVKRKLGDSGLTIVARVTLAVITACLSYFVVFQLLHLMFNINMQHENGYIGAMLFVIPGFPFITSGLDLSKLDMRSGLERAAYALLIIVCATIVGWGVAMILNLQPGKIEALELTPLMTTVFRVIASFFGVFGFSLMFNSKLTMATTAAIIGAIANTMRLSIVSYTHIPAAIAAFAAALLAGLLASLVRNRVAFPRIALTVPSIVIMVPGLYMYRAMFSFGLTNINIGAYWMIQTVMIVLALPAGLIAARILTDKKWRHVD